MEKELVQSAEEKVQNETETVQAEAVIAPEKPLKKQIRSDVNRGALTILLNLLIMNVVVLVGMVVRFFVEMFRQYSKTGNMMTAMDEEFLNSIMESGVESLIAVAIGTFFVWLIMHQKASFKSIFKSENAMRWQSFVKCLCVFMGVQLLVSGLNFVVELGLNQVGLTSQMGMEMASGGSKTISMFLYVSFGAPIVEEIIYRGFIMKSLQKYGKVFAIVISSILFGLMHMNLIQSIFAMVVGLILGYVAMNYSLKWSIFLHFVNNCIFSEGLTFATRSLEETTQNIIFYAIMIPIFIAGLVFLILDRKKISEYKKENAGERGCYKAAFTAAWLIVFIVLCSLGSLWVIQKL